jgi:toxin ParE1/3/4
MKLLWRPAAEQDRGHIFEYVFAESAQAAIALDNAFDDHIDHLIDFPASGIPGRVHDTRELVIPGTPYIVVYREQADQVLILRLFHAARRWPREFP